MERVIPSWEDIENFKTPLTSGEKYLIRFLDKYLPKDEYFKNGDSLWLFKLKECMTWSSIYSLNYIFKKNLELSILVILMVARYSIFIRLESGGNTVFLFFSILIKYSKQQISCKM